LFGTNDHGQTILEVIPDHFSNREINLVTAYARLTGRHEAWSQVLLTAMRSTS